MDKLALLGPDHLTGYLLVAAVLFALGVACTLVRRNAIGVLMGIELMLNAAGLDVAAYARFHQGGASLDGQALTLVIIVLAAAETTVALALLYGLRRTRGDIDLATATELQG